MAEPYAPWDVARALDRYFWSLDDRAFDEEHLRGVFTDDAVVTRPNGTSLEGPAAIGASHRESFARFARTQHLVSGHDVVLHSDEADVRANLQAMHLWAGSSGEVRAADDVFVAGGVIEARMVRTADGWRIARLGHRNVWRAGGGFAAMAQTDREPGAPR